MSSSQRHASYAALRFGEWKLLPPTTRRSSKRIAMLSIRYLKCKWLGERQVARLWGEGTGRQARHMLCSREVCIASCRWWSQSLIWRRSSCMCCIRWRSTWIDQRSGHRTQASKSPGFCTIFLKVEVIMVPPPQSSALTRKQISSPGYRISKEKCVYVKN